jgi:hypothetical protein
VERVSVISYDELFKRANAQVEVDGEKTLHEIILLRKGFAFGLLHAVEQMSHFGMSDDEIRAALGMVKP